MELTDKVLSRLQKKLTEAETTYEGGHRIHIDGTELAESLLAIKDIRALRDTAADAVLFHEQDYGFCMDPKCRCCAVLKKLKAMLPGREDAGTTPNPD